MPDASSFVICKTPLGNKAHTKFTTSAATLCGRWVSQLLSGYLPIDDQWLKQVDCQRCRSTLETYMEAEAKVSGKVPDV